MTTTQSNGNTPAPLTNYCSYVDPKTKAERIGHLHVGSNTIQPLAFRSGTPLTTLYEVIEVGQSGIIAVGEALDRSSTQLLAPITGRDILCVGKNYAAHAKEFNTSGFDSSDKVDQPTHPVIFTKRYTSIIADGDEIYPHPGFTETIDYEGEIAVIIGKPGFRISEADAMDYVWGYTICNDMTARERQRDHKQFYIGKSPDTFCPLGPVAVPAGKLEKVLRVQTHVNGEVRQDSTTEDLIFSIPYLIATMSEGQTLMPGDVLATGTPAGVGIGRKPPLYLKPNDEVVVSVTGLGELRNRIGSPSSRNTTLDRLRETKPTDRKPTSIGLPTINGKPIHYARLGADTQQNVVFVHGLGGTMDFWTPLIDTASLKSTHALHLFDFEGHGLSPTSPLSELSVASLATDLKGVFDHARISSGATVIAHSFGCLVAVQFALSHPDHVSKLVLLGPPPSPLPEAGSKASHARASLVRSQGMAGIVDAVVTAGTSEKTKQANSLAVAAVRLSLLGQDPEGYAKACSALASATFPLDCSLVEAETYIITGSEDKVSPPQLCERYVGELKKSAGLTVLEGVGHWHVFEDASGVAKAVLSILR